MPKQRNELGTLLNMYGIVFEPRGDPTPFIEKSIQPEDNPLVSVPPKFPVYRNTSAFSSPLSFSRPSSTKSNYAMDGSSSLPLYVVAQVHLVILEWIGL
ncbi:hypothetical protein TNCV_3381441 [Trichonephila clavipes]|nr:hypothetical protein TNCV_3381441 [Trichonephila clavipes]